jgi:poly(A) polymerase
MQALPLQFTENLRRTLAGCPPEVLPALAKLAGELGGQLYFVGGTVRDALLGRSALDFDLVVPAQARHWAERLRGQLGGGALVDLCGPDDETYRVVWRGIQFDLAAFRGQATELAADLRLRDFTINAMALAVDALARPGGAPLIDPLTGLADLRKRCLRHCPGAFAADPVRLLRAYRFAATLDFTVDPATAAEIAAHAPLIAGVAAERITAELRLIFASPRTSAALAMLSEAGLLPLLLPELYRSVGVVQPEFHHLDVFDHSFLALVMIERVIADPGRYFPGQGKSIKGYLEHPGRIAALKWAALLHDIGKPPTRAEHPRQPERITFYRHDTVGSELVAGIASRLKWSRRENVLVGELIAMHMQPFHLCNVQRSGGRLTRKAALKLCRRAKEELTGLFLLAMADALAGKGEKSPPRMEEEIARLFDRVEQLNREHIRPVLSGPPLLTGRDLIENFALQPGPMFAELLDGLATARVEGRVVDRESALAWVASALKRAW